MIYLNYPDKSSSDNKPVKREAMKKAEEAVRAFRMSNAPDNNENGGKIRSDVMGAYTGMAYDGGEPEQDADDL